MAKVLTRKDERDADRQIAIIERRSSRAAILHILRTLARDAARFPEQKRDLVRMAPITMIDCLQSKQGDACSVEDLAVILGYVAVHGRLPTAREIRGITFESSADYFTRKYPEDVKG